MKKFFTLIAVAVLAFAAQATEMTVCDGTDTNNYVPIYGLYVDTDGTFGQMIYPADLLTDMVGKEITGVKFYSPSINFYDATLQLSMAMTDKNDFEDYVAIEGATALCSIVPNFGDTEMTFVFDEPYLYEGGNLMVQVLVTEVGTWKGTSFYGVNMPYYYSLYQYQSAWSSTPSKYHEAFLPKATFTYEGGGDVPPVVDPTEKTGAPTFQGFTEDGIHGYFVEIIPTEESVIYYRIIYPDGTETEWTEYEEILSFEGDGKYRVEAYAVADGKLPSEEIAYEFVVAPITGIEEMMSGKEVAGVRYFNLAGQEMREANGLTIVVTTYTDGTTSAVKVVK
jgi:hypothetical protein